VQQWSDACTTIQKKEKKGGAEVDRGLHHHTTTKNKTRISGEATPAPPANKIERRKDQWRSDACTTLQQNRKK
jgi:hypothetical protein